MDRVSIVHDNFLSRLAAGDLPHVEVGGLGLPASKGLFDHQCLTRALDIVSREMQKAGRGFYTIGSSGHEGMAAVAHALRVDDIAFLHYRDAAFQIARGAQVGHEMCRDMLLSFACAADDPTSGGRHKVLGSRDLFIPPQTSTIASHLPKALGAAYGLGLARRARPERAILPRDGIAVASFGDASLNHSTAQGTINATGWTSVQGVPLPLLLICEDNGIGISTKTPRGWVRASLEHRPGLVYFSGDGLDLWDTYRAAAEAAAYVRTHRKPAVLHLRTVRLYGHAGADVATSYLPRAEVEADEANDPLLRSAAGLIALGLPAQDVLATYTDALARTRTEAARISDAPALEDAEAVMSAIVPPASGAPVPNGPSAQARAEIFGSDLALMAQPQPMSRLINWALSDLMLTHGETVVMGEDVGRKGGVYGVTRKLHSRFGPSRVIDTLLDEQSILGLAIGMAHNGFVPMPEIQFLAYLHNAEDQLRGEAATLPFFSNGQWANPMVLRIAGLGYQKGFGGHFHNDNALAVLRDIPGLIVACPSDGAEAAMMLRECHRLAREENRVCVFVEPIALYNTADVHAGDGAWLRAYPAPDRRIALGEVGVHGTGDLGIVTFGNGRYLAEQAGVANARIVDLRWISPLPGGAMLEALNGCSHVLVVDETRRSGGVAEAVMTALYEAGHRHIARYTAQDSFIATGRAYAATLPSAQGIADAAQALRNGV
ncbi:thiamine pyrophosphate-dependent enzyme [uncultured Tateyamaria sp.]|uniref:thiamine pyrophosphate-dependent enzyme n=1 Tax=uncultured Tateyamaria sp. TaxID=455651 RepID=UPI00261B26E4|nr:thiamine pyrophosphate-dependent enzyme [uncultured Tateyamaria sp.]